MKNRIGVLIVCIFFCSILTTCSHSAIKAQETNIIWDCSIQIFESGGKQDNVVFGEASDARDGSPADSYDVVKPPTPITPYVKATFNDNLPVPYDILWKDYRQYPDASKIWNLTIQWVPSSGSSSTIVTLSWMTSDLNESEYTSFILCTDTGAVLTDMLISDTYTFTCAAYLPQNLKIRCERLNNPPGTPSLPNGESRGYHGTSYVYSTSSTDPDNDDLFYQFDWGDGMMSNWFGPHHSGTTIQASYTWEVPGSFAVKARARDASGEQSSWSTAFIVEMMNRMPFLPVNSFPGTAAVNVQRNPTLRWIGGDPDGDLVTFDVFFGIQNPPPKVISNQSSVSFTPGVLLHQTTYYWRIIAWDEFGGSINGPVWSFTTIASDNGSSEPPVGDMNQTNTLPIADASGSEQRGFVGSLLVFNGSGSYDPDGYLSRWVWDFGDGMNGTGEVTFHRYQSLGLYTVALTVTDDKGATGTDTIIVEIGIANRPASTPIINGTYRGTKNTPYVYTVSSTDPENDFLRYSITWGDGTQNTSRLLPNNTSYICAHSWAAAGKYIVTATASDNITYSEECTWEVFIDVFFVRTLGFLFDTNNDEVYDSFYINATGGITDIQRLENGSFLLDTTDDGKWDYLFDPLTGSLEALSTGTIRIENQWLFIGIIVIAFIIIACIVFLYKRNYF